MLSTVTQPLTQLLYDDGLENVALVGRSGGDCPDARAHANPRSNFTLRQAEAISSVAVMSVWGDTILLPMAAESMTLAFEFEALRYLQQPRSVIVGARRCAQYVEVVTVDQDAARAFGTRHRVRMDFTSPIDAPDAFGGLDDVRTNFQTTRYVLIGVASQAVFGGPPDG
ncbi:DUF7124 domain-containing protein [Halocatena marina]|uniref:DUF7124 domain-containing protein n=1 Tax=Halocatena marina TaxID=2934937 RepID=UPI00200DB442|nr:hypothetical protein [Halocatena marina]